MPGKSKQPKVARFELRGDGGLYGSEKRGWSAGGMEKQPGNKKTFSQEKEQQQPTSQNPPGGSCEGTIVGSFIGL